MEEHHGLEVKCKPRSEQVLAQADESVTEHHNEDLAPEPKNNEEESRCQAVPAVS